MLKVEDLYKIVCELEEEKYDWEMKIRRQEFEVCLSSLLVIIQRFCTAVYTGLSMEWKFRISTGIISGGNFNGYGIYHVEIKLNGT